MITEVIKRWPDSLAAPASSWDGKSRLFFDPCLYSEWQIVVMIAFETQIFGSVLCG